MRLHRFSVLVDCRLESEIAEDVKKERLHEDRGVIFFPESYTQNGAPTRLVISCHGAGGTVSTDDSQVEHQVLTQYLLANGYAVMDVNGLPEAYAKEEGIDLRNNVGSPIAIRSYVKAYYYCIANFNLLHEVFVHGGSMGGISSTNLVLSGRLPVIAHTAYCPVLDAYGEIFLHPWSNGLPKVAMGKLYGFMTDENGEFLYDREKLQGYDPCTNDKIFHYPVPVRFWHCMDDAVVSYWTTKAFVERIQKNGGNAQLTTLARGGHEPQLFGKPVENPSGNVWLDGARLQILPAVEETFRWIRQFSEDG